MIIASVYPHPFETEIRHDSSSAIIAHDKIYAYEEAKLTKIKKDGSYPERSLLMGLKELGIKPDDVDHWVFPKTKALVSLKNLEIFFKNYLKAIKPSYNFSKFEKQRVHYLEHQMSHIALSVYGSNFNECLFLSTDGGGDVADQRGLVFGIFQNNKFKILNQSYGLNNLANYHSFVTDSLGFSGEDSGKTSGLSAYGKNKKNLEIEISKLLKLKKNNIHFVRERFGQTCINSKKINPDTYNREKIFNTYPSDTNILRKSIAFLPHDIAFTCEKIMQSKFLDFLKKLTKNIKINKIVFSGGLFENVSLNNMIIESNLFKDCYFSPAASDNGLSLGAAFYVKNKLKGYKNNKLLSKKQLSPYLGPSFSSNEILAEINNFKLNFKKTKDPSLYAAKKIFEGKIVGFFQGRGEFGARSLGNRSILADPRKSSSKARINQLLKKRDWFMPYAPAILETHLKEWVLIPKRSPYMQIAFKVKKDKISQIPAAVHKDNSSRFQTVKKNDNPIFWNLIKNFYNLSKVPMVLNTSFNRHGISTIASPRSAIEHLLEGSMDILIIGNFIIRYDKNRQLKKTKIIFKDEDYLLKLNSIKRLNVFKKYGTNDDYKNYLLQLSALLSISIIGLKFKKAKINNKVYHINDLINYLEKKIK